MEQKIAIALFVLWVAWVAQAWLSALNVKRFLRDIAKPVQLTKRYAPRATVIVPFKGMDPELPAALEELCQQNYPHYRMVWVVDSESDSVMPTLRDTIARHPEREISIVVSGRAPAHQGQKVHNQLAVLEQIEPGAADSDVWVFCDSDAVPGRMWLKHLVDPLHDKNVGMTTGYRWLVPERQGAVWSEMASVMNSSIACFLGRDRYTHAWGGSMALTVGAARQGQLIARLRGALTDDYQFSKLCRDLGRRIHFVPGALVPTPVDFSRASLVNFVHRQYLITRIYEPRLARWAAVMTGLYPLGFVTAMGVSIGALFNAAYFHNWTLSLPALLLVACGDFVRSHYRRRVVRQAFDEATVEKLRGALRWDRWGTPVWMGLHFVMVLRAFIGRTMVWRGTTYVLRGPQSVQRLGP
jgi:ceramide glucosyltransferase